MIFLFAKRNVEMELMINCHSVNSIIFLAYIMILFSVIIRPVDSLMGWGGGINI